MIESVKALALVVGATGLTLLTLLLVGSIHRALNARRDLRNLARNGKGITLTFGGKRITIAARLPDGWPGCETCAMESGVPVPDDPDGEITASFQCSKHYDLFADHMRDAWKRIQDEARRNA